MRILPVSHDELFDNEQEVDRGNRDTHFAGVLYQFKPLPSRDRLELYWYGLEQGNRPNNDALPRDLDSAGFRVFRPAAKGTWSYEIETLWQTGTSSATAAGVTRRDLERCGVLPLGSRLRVRRQVVASSVAPVRFRQR